MSQASQTRRYVSALRRQGADDTRRRILEAARALFAKDGIDRVTIERIATRAKVAEPTVYAVFKSKVGILREIMTNAIFSARYHEATARLDETSDPIVLLRLTATVARTIYENEAREIGLLRGASMFSPELRKLEREFESARFDLQRKRVELLNERSLLPGGMDVESARRIMWMYTSRDMYRMMVVEGGWSPDRFEAWLADTLVSALSIGATTKTETGTGGARRLK
jgi:AcrR family transcriptional regulator